MILTIITKSLNFLVSRTAQPAGTAMYHSHLLFIMNFDIDIN